MINTTPYRVLSAPLMVQTEVKRSKFLAYIAPTAGIKAAKAFVNEIKAKHPDASHNCWAFVADRPENSVDIGYSDDGEPSGCAGKPMLKVLQGSDIGEITVVVTRYFGGTKLGTGGMARAYGAAVTAVLAQAQVREKAVEQSLSFSCEYHWNNTVETLLKQCDATVVSANYTELIYYEILLDVRQIENFTKLLFQRSNGQLSIANND